MAKKDLIAPFAVIVALMLIFFPGFSRYQKVSAECRKLKAEIEALQKANVQLEKEKYKLEHDIEYVEKRARNKLGVVRKGEIPYKKTKEGEKDEQ